MTEGGGNDPFDVLVRKFNSFSLACFSAFLADISSPRNLSASAWRFSDSSTKRAVRYSASRVFRSKWTCKVQRSFNTNSKWGWYDRHRNSAWCVLSIAPQQPAPTSQAPYNNGARNTGIPFSLLLFSVLTPILIRIELRSRLPPFCIAKSEATILWCDDAS